MLIELLTKKYPGMRLWLAQRLSAVVMAVYLIIFALLLLMKQPVGYEGWLELMSPWWWRLFTLLFFISLVMHAWLGVRDVFKDYIFNLKLRAVMQILVDVLLIVYLFWSGVILWGIQFS
ncbi:MAG TPA: succinate dehydrogenase, hydrophobic membrane anchor protein [Methylotenera sp.]|jgi:succinate dehydrogenase / fumarate reductase membrane anchor subunit